MQSVNYRFSKPLNEKQSLKVQKFAIQQSLKKYKLRIRCQGSEESRPSPPNLISDRMRKRLSQSKLLQQQYQQQSKARPISGPEQVTQKDQQQQQQQQQPPTKPRTAKYAVLLNDLERKLSTQYVQSGRSDIAELKKEYVRLIKKAKQLQADKEEIEKSQTSIKEQLLRLSSDFENYRKRSETERKSYADQERASIVEVLLPIVDNFELASQQIQTATPSEDKINESYQGVYRQMVDIFRGLGVSVIDTIGALFDPNVHEAIMREINQEVPDGTILEEFRKGFLINGKLIRPAMVKVSYREDAQSSLEEIQEDNDVAKSDQQQQQQQDASNPQVQQG
eukprot:TRINITY_DN2468_c0_g1_i1.p1 TRINITY_DN2468_c0_g1~~TRINITY_DN2468_c0_g1_i1.p1  ORF type:complete len:337 (-),score=47.19 TRINITY_DN2468_c0_g1_i1:461-1471(-)